MSAALVRVALDLETRLCSAAACPNEAERGTTRCRLHPDGQAELARLAEDAVGAHQAAGTALHDAIASGIRCGEALLAAREIIKRTPAVKWKDWLVANVGINDRYAYGYMRLFVHRDALPPEAFEPYIDGRGSRRQPSVARAIEMAAHLPAVTDKASHWRLPEDKHAEIARLAAEGLTYAEISRRAGVHHVTVSRILNPEHDRSLRESSNRAKRRQTAAQRAAANAELEQRIAAALAARPALTEPYRRACTLVTDLAGDPALRHAHRYAKAARNALAAALLEAA